MAESAPHGSRSNTFVVINPTAGGGRAGKAWPAIAKELQARLGPYDRAQTSSVQGATALVREAVRNGAHSIIAVGGDGTINEAVNGLATAGEDAMRHIAFAAIPLGTGSDFSRSVASGRDPQDAIRRICSGETRMIDIGRVVYHDDLGKEATRYFANIASLGLSGLIDRAVNASRVVPLLPRKTIFLAASVRALLKYEFRRVRIVIDDGPPIESEIALVAIANGRFFGGGMMIAPDAEPDDGLFDIVVLKGASKAVLLRDLHLVYGGRHRNHPAIRIVRGRNVVVEALDAPPEGPVLLDIDGESPGRLPAHFEMRPAALKLRC